ncbi:IS30 family transposase [Antrihabitans cavernicola]|uniref:IS30 family transposase n=1 Tax=Antrihabitans cavernicola TaxID=2495913 RepID=A0A5A7SG17_9NOCA|nr:IS30 family transposase [Spelaeibacter cavernicola]
MQPFWNRVAEGRSPAQAALDIGVAEHTGQRWFGDAGGVKPAYAEPKSDGPRPRLTLADRIEIEIGVRTDESIHSIANRLRRAPSTIKREIDNGIEQQTSQDHPSGYRRKQCFGARQSGRTARVAYSAIAAQRRSELRARRPKPTKLATHDRLREVVQDRLQGKYSPEQIQGWLRLEFPDDQDMQVSDETIYKAIYLQGRGGLRRELHACLRTGRALRKPARSSDTRGRIPNMINIADRPPEADDRAIAGHWEGDLIIGADSTAIGTVVERRSGFVLLLHLPDNHTAATVADQVILKMSALPRILRRTLTWDQGKEMSNHAQIASATELGIYFCDPHSPWQRGTNENTNGLLRQYFPKGTDLSVFPADYLDYVATQLNNRPRKRHEFKTPAQILDQILSETPPVASTA